jgi:hypothetical protein
MLVSKLLFYCFFDRIDLNDMFVAGSREQENSIKISHLLVTVKLKIGFCD